MIILVYKCVEKVKGDKIHAFCESGRLKAGDASGKTDL